jgi:hypothetical protein
MDNDFELLSLSCLLEQLGKDGRRRLALKQESMTELGLDSIRNPKSRAKLSLDLQNIDFNSVSLGIQGQFLARKIVRSERHGEGGVYEPDLFVSEKQADEFLVESMDHALHRELSCTYHMEVSKTDLVDFDFWWMANELYGFLCLSLSLARGRD